MCQFSLLSWLPWLTFTAGYYFLSPCCEGSHWASEQTSRTDHRTTLTAMHMSCQKKGWKILLWVDGKMLYLMQKTQRMLTLQLKTLDLFWNDIQHFIFIIVLKL